MAAIGRLQSSSGTPPASPKTGGPADPAIGTKAGAEEPAPPIGTGKTFDSKEVDRLMEDIQKQLNALTEGHRVSFRKDEETGTTVIEVRDPEGNLIRQFPPEKLLNLRRKQDDLSGMVIDRMT